MLIVNSRKAVKILKLQEIIAERKISRNKLALQSQITPADLYTALNGNKPFYPEWRKRIAAVLGMRESEVFPEFQDKR